MSVVQVARSTHAMGAVIYAAYGRGKDAKERTQRAAALSYFSIDSAGTPEAWCQEGLQRVHGAATERKNEAFLITQSFSPEEFSGDNEKDVARVHGAGMELAAELAANSPYFVATHTDAKGGHVHNHIVVLNHDYSTGKGAPKSLKHHPSVRKANDSVMRDLGMEVTKQDEVHLTPVEAHALRQGRSIDPVPLDEINNDNWRHTLRQRVMELREDPAVETMDDFIELGLTHNVSIRSRQGRGKNKDKTYLTYALVDDNDNPLKVNNRRCSERASKLGTDFHFEQIQQRLREKQKEKQEEAKEAALAEAERQELERNEDEKSVYTTKETTDSAREEDSDRAKRFSRYDSAEKLLQEGEAADRDGNSKGPRRTAKWAEGVRQRLEEDSRVYRRGTTRPSGEAERPGGGERSAVKTDEGAVPQTDRTGLHTAQPDHDSRGDGTQRRDVPTAADGVEGAGRIFDKEREQRRGAIREDAGELGGDAQAPARAGGDQDGYSLTERGRRKDRRTRKRGFDELRRQLNEQAEKRDEKDAGNEFGPDF